MINLYVLFVMLILFWSQLLLGGLSLHIPLCISGIFYISVTYSWRYGILWAVLCGLSFDLLYNRDFFMYTWALLLAVAFSQYWRKDNDLRLRNCIFPGAFIALLSVLPACIYKVMLYPADIVNVMKEILPVTIFALSFNALFLPFLIMLLDDIGERIKMPLFSNANRKAS